MVGGEVPIYHPTREEIGGTFEAYIEKLERKPAFRKAGICKIVAPEGWQPRSGPYEDSADLLIARPIKQICTGSKGLYRAMYIEQKAMSLRDFAAHAKAPDNQPGTTDPSEVERKYWRSVAVCPPLYGADVPGSLFDEKTEGWNLRRLDTILSTVLRESGHELPGVNSPYLYFGTWRSTFAWHREDMDLYSVNYLHYGASKSWYCIPTEHRARFENVVKGLLPDLFRACPEFFRHKELIISPHLLDQYHIPYVKIVQHPREFVINAPGAYHAGFNQGYNCAESVNFGTKRWVAMGALAGVCECRPDTVTIDMRLFRHLVPARSLPPELFEDSSDDESSSSFDTSDAGSERGRSGRRSQQRKRRRRGRGDSSSDCSSGEEDEEARRPAGRRKASSSGGSRQRHTQAQQQRNGKSGTHPASQLAGRKTLTSMRAAAAAAAAGKTSAGRSMAPVAAGASASGLEGEQRRARLMAQLLRIHRAVGTAAVTPAAGAGTHAAAPGGAAAASGRSTRSAGGPLMAGLSLEGREPVRPRHSATRKASEPGTDMVAAEPRVAVKAEGGEVRHEGAALLPPAAAAAQGGAHSGSDAQCCGLRHERSHGHGGRTPSPSDDQKQRSSPSGTPSRLRKVILIGAVDRVVPVPVPEPRHAEDVDEPGSGARPRKTARTDAHVEAAAAHRGSIVGRAPSPAAASRASQPGSPAHPLLPAAPAAGAGDPAGTGASARGVSTDNATDGRAQSPASGEAGAPIAAAAGAAAGAGAALTMASQPRAHQAASPGPPVRGTASRLASAAKAVALAFASMRGRHMREDNNGACTTGSVAGTAGNAAHTNTGPAVAAAAAAAAGSTAAAAGTGAVGGTALPDIGSPATAASAALGLPSQPAGVTDAVGAAVSASVPVAAQSATHTRPQRARKGVHAHRSGSTPAGSDGAPGAAMVAVTATRSGAKRSPAAVAAAASSTPPAAPHSPAAALEGLVAEEGMLGHESRSQQQQPSPHQWPLHQAQQQHQHQWRGSQQHAPPSQQPHPAHLQTPTQQQLAQKLLAAVATHKKQQQLAKEQQAREQLAMQQQQHPPPGAVLHKAQQEQAQHEVQEQLLQLLLREQVQRQQQPSHQAAAGTADDAPSDPAQPSRLCTLKLGNAVPPRTSQGVARQQQWQQASPHQHPQQQQHRERLQLQPAPTAATAQEKLGAVPGQQAVAQAHPVGQAEPHPDGAEHGGSSDSGEASASTAVLPATGTGTGAALPGFRGEEVARSPQEEQVQGRLASQELGHEQQLSLHAEQQKQQRQGTPLPDAVVPSPAATGGRQKRTIKLTEKMLQQDGGPARLLLLHQREARA